MSFLLTWLPTIIVFILMLAVLVLAHEFGHFIVAKRAGMTVEEFGFGFPPRIWGKKIRGTLYSINLIPLGGFVKILGEGEESGSPHSFSSKSIKARIMVVVAGVVMNFILGYLAFLLAFWSGLPPMATSPSAYDGVIRSGSGGLIIKNIDTNSLAEKNNLQINDTIMSVNQRERTSVSDLRQILAENQRGTIEIKIQRDKKEFLQKIEIGENKFLGVTLLEKIEKVDYVWWKVPYYALLETGRVIILATVKIGTVLKDLIVSRIVPEDIGGPVAIFGITSVAVQLGFAYVLSLFINLTIVIGIMNILPFPALDGGRLIFLVVEKIRGRKIAQKVETAIHNIGFILLLVLLVLLTWRDVARF
ncbi:site-2 protease family protein [Candidatus Microgenomates bacterium]|nr:site-2 protease family protein [Candidatus Microgenomates bacterium]